jgi:hypothetical protein
MEYPDSVMGQTQLYCSVKLVNGIPTQSLSITGSPTPIQIKKNNEISLHRFFSTQKDHNSITKMNDNTNMDSTIEGSMNVRG